MQPQLKTPTWSAESQTYVLPSIGGMEDAALQCIHDYACTVLGIPGAVMQQIAWSGIALHCTPSLADLQDILIGRCATTETMYYQSDLLCHASQAGLYITDHWHGAALQYGC